MMPWGRAAGLGGGAALSDYNHGRFRKRHGPSGRASRQAGSVARAPIDAGGRAGGCGGRSAWTLRQAAAGGAGGPGREVAGWVCANLRGVAWDGVATRGEGARKAAGPGARQGAIRAQMAWPRVQNETRSSSWRGRGIPCCPWERGGCGSTKVFLISVNGGSRVAEAAGQAACAGRACSAAGWRAAGLAGQPGPSA
jgi:hypothetical protein